MLARRSHYSQHRREKYYRINLNITAQTLRLLDETGKQIGVFTKDEALRRARAANLDLVEIAPLAKPPVCKVIDFKKFRYQEAKKERESRKKTKNVGTKEIILSPFIGEHDFVIKINKGREFLKASNKLKATVRFKGRQLGKKEFGFKLLQRVILSLEDVAKVEVPPRHEGRFIMVQLTPVKKSTVINHETKNEKVNPQALQVDRDREAPKAPPKQPAPKTP